MRKYISLTLSCLFVQVVANDCLDGGEIMKGQTCTIASDKRVELKSESLKNSGTLNLENNTVIVFQSSSDSSPLSNLSVVSNDQRGKINIQGNSTLGDDKFQNLSISGQDIWIKDRYKWTIKTQNLVFGGSGDTDSKAVLTASTSAELYLQTTQSLDLKQAQFKNLKVSSDSLKTLGLGQVEFDNTTMSSSASLKIGQDASGSASGVSNVVLKNKSHIKAENEAILQGEYHLSGGGTLIVGGGSMRVGQSLQGKEPQAFKAILKGSYSTEKEGQKTAIGFYGNKAGLGVVFDQVKVEDLRVQIVRDGDEQGAILSNITTSLYGGILEGRDTNGESQVLVIENGNTDLKNQGKIDVYGLSVEGNKTQNTTLEGTEIRIYGQEIALNSTDSKSATLVFKTQDDNGVISLGRENTQDPSRVQGGGNEASNKDGEVLITSTNPARSSLSGVLQLRAREFNFDGNVTLKNLLVQTQSQNAGIIFRGSGEQGMLILENANLTAGIANDKGEGKYQSLHFLSSNAEQSNLLIRTNIAMRASNFVFEDQKIQLANQESQASSLQLYAYGETDLLKENEWAPSGDFVFKNTYFGISSVSPAERANPRSNLKLYTGEEGAKIFSSGLVLEDVDLQSYKIDQASQESLNILDISDASSNLTALGEVNIQAQAFRYQKSKSEGVGMDLFVGNAKKTGALVLKSDGNATTPQEEAGRKFVLGGVLTLDSTSAKASERSTFDIQMGSDKLSNYQIDLQVEGGLSVLHKNAADQSTEFKAKSFVFTPSSVIYSKNGLLKLIATTQDMEIQGKTVLEGTESAKASIQAQNNTESSITLTLKDVLVRGSAELKEEIKFKQSHIAIEGNDQAKTLTIQSQGSVENIDLISLKSGVMDLKSSSAGGQTELKLNQGAMIVSSGDSELKSAKISINQSNADQSNTFVLKVLDGTLKLLETTAGNAIGEITLGVKDQAGGAHLVLLQDDSVYNKLIFQDDLISYGASSITASQFEIKDRALITIHSGNLDLIAKSDVGLKIQSGEIVLNSGTLSYYQAGSVLADASEDKKLGAITLGGETNAFTTPELKVTVNGNSSIQANALTINGAEIHIKQGSLDLIGLQDQSKFGNLVLNGSSLAAYAGHQKSEQSSIKLAQGKAITMIANAPFVSPNAPLGGGNFGQISAKSVEFDSADGQKLISLVIDPTNAPSGEALFSLREGDQILIQTKEGIKKKASGEKITLNDVALDLGGYQSLTITPKLIEDEKKTSVLSLALGVSVKQTTILELAESIKDPQKRKEMIAVILDGRNEEIANSILLSPNNPLKIGVSENTIAGNVALMSDMLYRTQDAFETLANLTQSAYKIYDQIQMLTWTNLYNRLARIGNPHQASEEVASILQSVRQHSYASNSDDLFAENVGEKGGLWATYSGAMLSGSGVSGNANGLSVGYDGVIDSQVLLGGYVSYLYGAQKENFLHDASHNINFGLYSRMKFGGSEIDLVLAQTVGLMTSTLDVGNGAVNLGGEFEHNYYATNFQARYGYAFGVGEESSPYYLKPFVGVEGVFLLNDGVEVPSIAPIRANKRQSFFLDLNTGLEVRKYFNPQSYFFITPLVQAGVFQMGEDAQVGFVGSKSLDYSFEYKQDVNVGVYAGGQGSVSDNLAITGSMGLKMGVKSLNVLTSWNVGLRYKF